MYSETELIEQCIKGDRKCQEMLYKQYSSKMFGICLGYMSDHDAAKEILQEGFIKIFSSLKQYKGNGSFEGWIRKIIVNTAIDHYKKHLRDNRNLTIEDVKSFPLEVSVPDKILEKELLMLIKKLPEGARVIFNLYAVEGYNHNEIAEMLDISSGTSKSQFSRARMLLQDWIGKLYNTKKEVEYENS